MSDITNDTQTKADELPKDIEDLVAAVGSLPSEHRESLEPLLVRVLQSTRRRRRILNLVQDALSQLRLDMKYLMFDLEATRRERDEFRRQAESNTEEG
ncbi:MAG: transcriptional regulator [Pirellulales bacterium]|nr:transcriptional regulator [Pirellulales bacterium]